MKASSQNELIGIVAMQSALTHMPNNCLNMANAMLVLPLIFDKNIRSILKRKNSLTLSSKDLLLSFPADFVTIATRYNDLTLTSMNTILFALEVGMITFKDERISLINKLFSLDDSKIGKTAKDILLAGPKLSLILEEPSEELYQNFRITL
ncbi:MULTISPECIES: three component ABC system middle component [unclassified Enterobacter]|jgi:hypothetical protein|uniref:three component ABC system middle component n=1 Tax=unclassified Enterobacter TaxID=2608935 RepID=UPI0015CB5D9B|nr:MULTISPECIES: three component ABC system middle component [unclassified Enterobacter]MBB3303930.1 hypothetical protein [Enterobacter sp. Sphag1F]NYI12965.1 hypothetical protein [Enterobacter sp. Sphag71]